MSHFNEILRVIVAIFGAGILGPGAAGLVGGFFKYDENSAATKAIVWGVPVATGVGCYYLAKAII